MTLKEQITLPVLQPWSEIRLRDYQGLKLRKKANIVVVFPRCRGPIISMCTLRRSGLGLRLRVSIVSKALIRPNSSPFRVCKTSVSVQETWLQTGDSDWPQRTSRVSPFPHDEAIHPSAETSTEDAPTLASIDKLSFPFINYLSPLKMLGWENCIWRRLAR